MKFIKVKYTGDEGVWINTAHISAVLDRVDDEGETSFTEVRLINGQVIRATRQDACDILAECGLALNNRASIAAVPGVMNTKAV